MKLNGIATQQTPPESPATRAIKRQRKTVNGRRVLLKNAASAKNAQPKRVAIIHGGNSRAFRGALDRRFAAGKIDAAYRAEYRAHLGGGDLDVPLADLCDMAARLKLLANIAYADLVAQGALDKKGNPRPALDTYRRVAADQREVLRLLGLRRATKPIPDLQNYLQEKYGGHAHDH